MPCVKYSKSELASRCKKRKGASATYVRDVVRNGKVLHRAGALKTKKSMISTCGKGGACKKLSELSKAELLKKAVALGCDKYTRATTTVSKASGKKVTHAAGTQKTKASLIASLRARRAARKVSKKK